MRWFNVNECGEVYDDHETEAAARAVNDDYPNDTVVYASCVEEAEDIAYEEIREENLFQQAENLREMMELGHV